MLLLTFNSLLEFSHAISLGDSWFGAWTKAPISVASVVQSLLILCHGILHLAASLLITTHSPRHPDSNSIVKGEDAEYQLELRLKEDESASVLDGGRLCATDDWQHYVVFVTQGVLVWLLLLVK